MIHASFLLLLWFSLINTNLISICFSDHHGNIHYMLYIVVLYICLLLVIHVQYISKICTRFFLCCALLCFVVVLHWLIFPYPSGLLHWHCGNLTIAPVPAKQPWWIWMNTSCKVIMNDCITTTKQSTTKPCAYFLRYTVLLLLLLQLLLLSLPLLSLPLRLAPPTPPLPTTPTPPPTTIYKLLTTTATAAAATTSSSNTQLEIHSPPHGFVTLVF